MIFSSFSFLLFFLIVIALVIIAPQRVRKLVLLGASYYFYAYWDYRFTLLIFTSTIIDYCIGRWLGQAHSEPMRRLLLSVSLAANLGMLFFFKYYNFFVDSASEILVAWGMGVSNLDIILPVGISFYTFQTMSYTIDIYRKQLEPLHNFFDFALFVSFFPQLVAGPIVRASRFLPQLDNPVVIRKDNVWAGSQIFIVGLFKKLMIADAVAPLVDQVYAHPEYFGSATVWLAVAAYSIQIYADFSGYSDMAIGCARILGFRFAQNFDMPYLSANITEFWRRWHISLSSWLRDYLYIPLGGNRKGISRTYVNLMITMVLGGLWHGASWNFVLWGLLHGIALSLHRLWQGTSFVQNRRALSSAPFAIGAITYYVNIFCTALFVTVVWVFFRSQTFATTLAIYKKLLFIDSFGAEWPYVYAFIAIGVCLVAHAVGSFRRPKELVFFQTPNSFLAASVTMLTLIIIYVFAPTNASPFIYFQF